MNSYPSQADINHAIRMQGYRRDIACEILAERHEAELRAIMATVTDAQLHSYLFR